MEQRDRARIAQLEEEVDKLKKEDGGAGCLFMVLLIITFFFGYITTDLSNRIKKLENPPAQESSEGK